MCFCFTALSHFLKPAFACSAVGLTLVLGSSRVCHSAFYCESRVEILWFDQPGLWLYHLQLQLKSCSRYQVHDWQERSQMWSPAAVKFFCWVTVAFLLTVCFLWWCSSFWLKTTSWPFSLQCTSLWKSKWATLHSSHLLLLKKNLFHQCLLLSNTSASTHCRFCCILL